jgi:hypothetical protein
MERFVKGKPSSLFVPDVSEKYYFVYLPWSNVIKTFFDVTYKILAQSKAEYEVFNRV